MRIFQTECDPVFRTICRQPERSRQKNSSIGGQAVKTVKVTPDNIISVIDVNFDDFRDLQKAVGGRFEIVSTKTLFETFKMPMIMLVDEDGRMKQKEVNRLGSYFYDTDRHGWPILGDVVFAIAAGEDIEAPSDAEALKIFLKMNFSYLEE
ncbi:DUF3846 domain-containing protein [Coprococcus comes]|nr:DUF3846 domain-containing protein [Coprococcus comes]